MKIVIYGTPFHESYEITFQQIINTLESKKVKLIFYKKFYLFAKSKKIKFKNKVKYFEDYTTLSKIKNISFFLSVGGDGTFLNAITLIKNLKIPILGINTGRLGFISSIATYQVYDAINYLLNNDFSIQKRSLLSLKTKNNIFGNMNFALNEISVLRKDTSSMIKIHAYLNNEFLNTYWADGLIISTPTGSTGYSLSSGGPILIPGTNNLVITPVAPHNLNVRPIVISSTDKIKLTVEDRDELCLITLDSRSRAVKTNNDIIIEKCKFNINVIEIPEQTFIATINEKLMCTVMMSVITLIMMISCQHESQHTHSPVTSFSNSKDSMSYSIGADIGDNLINQNVDIDYDAFITGLKNGYEKKEHLLTMQDRKGLFKPLLTNLSEVIETTRMSPLLLAS